MNLESKFGEEIAKYISQGLGLGIILNPFPSTVCQDLQDLTGVCTNIRNNSTEKNTDFYVQ